MTLSQLQCLFADAGCKKLYAKPLAENDNSKNQVYFGPGFEALNLFPTEGIVPDSSPKNPIFKARLRFGWLLPNGQVAAVPGAQLILYPQYPEVRFSGFLRGCAQAPADLMADRLQGRILFLGVTDTSQVIGFVAGAETAIAATFRANAAHPTMGVFFDLALPNVPDEVVSRARLLTELRRVNRLGWIDSKQLAADGSIEPCSAPQGGGFTLEAELGIAKNSAADPDLYGWEIKQHAVSNFVNLGAGAITLMTPEPTGGYYREHGVEAFVRKFGYADKLGRVDRLNFGGVHKVGARHITTHLTMELRGFDATTRRITDVNGQIVLLADGGDIAASWAFSGLLEHWAHKHAKAAYVPSQRRLEPARQYRYGDKVRLAERTDSLRLLQAMFEGAVYYDPGIKLEGASTERPRNKRRSQFRVASKNIAALYETVQLVPL